MKTWLRPSVAIAAGVLVVLAATGITLGMHAAAAGGGSGKGARTRTVLSGSSAVCERLLVPAYFSPPYWETAIHAQKPPADMILDVTGVGAGTAPNAELLYLVKQARAAGITILGYSTTNVGERPVAEVETDVRHYAAWYGVTSIFLDRVSGRTKQVAYYKKLASYIHHAHKGAQVWLNPGVYPERSYMSIGDVVMVFENTYSQYLTAKVPSWAKDYPASRFVQTIYATPGAALTDALQTARKRNAGHIYVTDLVGSNPYQGLPSYWATEDAEATAGCTAKK
jgi:hypothetical protein